eukprot:SAG31_NODE_16_length_36206_cov_27.355728_5_plen_31_part_00
MQIRVDAFACIPINLYLSESLYNIIDLMSQ